MELNQLRVALDGPSSAGKSTIAKEVAKKTGLHYVDTGALYRTVGLYAYENGVSHTDEKGIAALLDTIDVKLTFPDGVQCVLLCGKPVGERIRTETASLYSSAVAKIPAVREYLLGMQQKIAAEGGVIMDGRDIGTVIMPDAEVKIFMTASAETRADRRYREQVARGLDVNYEDILRSIIDRDRQDSGRKEAPLRPADDAIFFDNGEYSIAESADWIIEHMKRYCENKRASGV